MNVAQAEHLGGGGDMTPSSPCGDPHCTSAYLSLSALADRHSAFQHMHTRYPRTEMLEIASSRSKPLSYQRCL